MQELQRMIIESYFSVVFMMIAQVTTTVVSFHHRKRFRELKYFHWYPLAAFLQSSITLSTIGLDIDPDKKIQRTSISLFIVIEFLLIYFFAFKNIKLKRYRALLKFIFAAFLLYVLYGWTRTNGILKYYEIYFIQSIILLLPSLLYFFQIFRLPVTSNPVSAPAFWINVGILFFFSSTIPLFILENYSRNFISHNQYLYSISYTAYGVFFILICKAYLCRIVTRLDYSLS